MSPLGLKSLGFSLRGFASSYRRSYYSFATWLIFATRLSFTWLSFESTLCFSFAVRSKLSTVQFCFERSCNSFTISTKWCINSSLAAESSSSTAQKCFCFERSCSSFAVSAYQCFAFSFAGLTRLSSVKN